MHELDHSQIDQLVQQSTFPLDASPAVYFPYGPLDPTADNLMEMSAIHCTPPPFAIPTPFYFSASWIEEELTKVLDDGRFGFSGDSTSIHH